MSVAPCPPACGLRPERSRYEDKPLFSRDERETLKPLYIPSAIAQTHIYSGFVGKHTLNVGGVLGSVKKIIMAMESTSVCSSKLDVRPS